MRKTLTSLMLIAALALAACGRPVDPATIGGADEIPPGPGLLTGPSGELTHTF